MPATVSGVFVSISPVNQAGAGFVVAYPTGATRPTTSLNWPDTHPTALTTAVDVDSSGYFTVYVGGGGPTDVIVDVLGYFSGALAAYGPGRSRLSKLGCSTPAAPARWQAVP